MTTLVLQAATVLAACLFFPIWARYNAYPVPVTVPYRSRNRNIS